MFDYESTVKNAFSVLLNDEVETAISRCESLEKQHPDRGEHLFVFALASIVLNDLPKAIEFLAEGHKRCPDFKEFIDALAVLSARMGNLSDSVYFAKLGMVAQSSRLLDGMMPAELREVEESIENVSIANFAVEGWIALHERRYKDAVDLAGKQIAMDGGDGDVYFLMGQAKGALHDYAGAIEAVEEAIRRDSELIRARVYLGDLYEATGRMGEALELYRRIIERQPDSLSAMNRLVLALAHGGAEEQSDIRRAIGSVGALLGRGAGTGNTERRKPPQPLERVRIGYLVNEHAIRNYAGFLETALTDREERRFRTMVYQQYSQPFAGDSRLRRIADDWRPTFDIDDETLAVIIENDDIHVLVDMCGFAPGNRQAVLARKVCPVQVNWLGLPLLGSPETTDWVVDDRQTGGGEAIDGVARCTMPGSMVSYQGGSVEIEISRDNPSPVKANGFVTFGGLLELSSISGMVDTWAEILRAVPESRLVLGAGGRIDEESAQRVADWFRAHGLSDRVVVHRPNSPSTARAEFLAVIDIFLDAPVAGGADLICDTLWMGVPVVGMQGDWPSARLGASVLAAAGRYTWIGDGADDYVDIARRLAAYPAQLEKHRAGLRAEIQSSSLCDTTTFMRQMESAFVALCEHACNAA